MNNIKGRLKLLVVDDAALLREVLCEQLRLLGHEAIGAENGEQALTLFAETTPDVVLMDWEMPVMDGIAATRAIRTLPGARWVPIIMLSAHGEESEFVSALHNGCDDYLIKPIKLPMLEAKIHALQRIAAMHNEIERSQRELQNFYAQAEDELNLARHIMARLVRSKNDNAAAAEHVTRSRWSEAASSVSGDIILVAAAGNGVTYTMLGDATGHGLAAAITLIPIVNVFYAMTAKGFGVATIVEEMNRQVRTYCPVERFVALTLVGVTEQESVIEVWNGGIPPLLLLDAQGNEVRRFQSRHLPLGVVDGDAFSSMPEFFHYDSTLQLIAYSDGLLEAGVDEQFGFERVLATLSAAPPPLRVLAVQQALRNFLGDSKHHDDISIVLIECPLPSLTSEPGRIAERSISIVQNDWSLQTTLSAQQLKEIDFVPMVVDWAQAMGLAREHGSTFFLVITELFTNALEHGLLELSSLIKLEANGFERFMQLRQERLNALSEGRIHIALLSRRTDAGSLISIYMQDSGNGFPVLSSEASGFSDNATPAGRGIPLVKKFCRMLEYRGNGNEVYAELLC